MRNAEVDSHIARIKARHFPYSVQRAGISVDVFADVYPTSEVSELVVECMDLLELRGSFSSGSTVLDYGTGTGFLAVQAALRGAKVVGLDINPSAVSCAVHNARLNKVEDRVEFRISRELDAIKADETFDAVLAGLPWDNGHADSFLERALYDEDLAMRTALFDSASSLLKVDGFILLTYSQSAEKRLPTLDDRFDRVLMKERLIRDDPHYVFCMKIKS